MDDPKTSVSSSTSPTGAPPANLPVASDTHKSTIQPVPVKPASFPPPAASSIVPKSPSVSSPPTTPVIPPSASHPLPPAPQGEITVPHSSIRTMESDIKSVKSGQAPKSIEIKPSTIPAEKPIISPLPVKPTPSAPAPLVGVRLGEAEKRTTSLPGQSIPKPEPKAPEKITPPAPAPVPAPLLKSPPVLSPKPAATPPLGAVAVPPKLSIFANRKVLGLIAIIILVLVGGFLYWQSSQNTEVAQPTFTPRISLSSTPEVPLSPASTTLTSIFPQFFHLAVSPDDQDALANFNFEAVNVSNKSSAQKNTLVFVKEGSGDFYKFSNFLNRFSVGYPTNLSSSLDNNDFGIILTKATEFFDQNGQMIASPSAEMLLKPQTALVVRVVDATEAKQQLSFWEDTMGENLKEFYGLPAQFGDLHFSESLYQGTKIRYVNFPYPDKAIDYAIVTAKNGNDYLIIANSREQMFSLIKKLLGF